MSECVCAPASYIIAIFTPSPQQAMPPSPTHIPLFQSKHPPPLPLPSPSLPPLTQVQVSIVAHDGHVLAPQLHLDGHHARLTADVQPGVAAGEGDAVDAGVGGEVVADLAAAPGDCIQHSGGDARGVEALRDRGGRGDGRVGMWGGGGVGEAFFLPISIDAGIMNGNCFSIIIVVFGVITIYPNPCIYNLSFLLYNQY